MPTRGMIEDEEVCQRVQEWIDAQLDVLVKKSKTKLEERDRAWTQGSIDFLLHTRFALTGGGTSSCPNGFHKTSARS